MEKRNWLRKHYVRLLILFFVIAITVSIFLYRDKIAEFGNFGYLGVFLVSLITSATIILPAPGIIIILALGTVLSPVLVGLTAGTGAALGEMTAYLAGFSGRGLVENRRLYNRLEGWLNTKWGVIVIFVFAATPLPFDILGIVAGVLRFPIWKFFIACWLGKTTFWMVTALLGAWWWEGLLHFFS
jgi:membrane protein YqaA with SNARE-associated domain